MQKLPFSELGLSEATLKAVEKLGFEQTSPIQSAAIPVLMAGKDVVGQSATGSGKTAAFAIPGIERVLDTDRKVQILVLVPTRELAVQVAEEFARLSAFRPKVHAVPIYGGASYERQFSELRKGPQIVIGTPGRIIDHLQRNTLDLSEVKLAVLDECDRMLDMGFREDMERILSSAPKERQTVFFSATLPPAIKRLIEQFSNKPEHIKIESQAMTVPTVEQVFFDVPPRAKLDALTRLIDVHDARLTIIFANTQRTVDELTDDLLARGYSADRLHGGISQALRTRTMGKFKRSEFEILVATDVAGRGLDVDDLDLVINYDLPYDPEDYVHRIGRTGRAGRKGVALTLVSGREVYRLQHVERFTRQRIRRGHVPTWDQVEEKRLSEVLDKTRAIMEAGEHTAKGIYIDRLLDEGHAATDLAAALLHQLLASEGVELQKPGSSDPFAQKLPPGAKPAAPVAKPAALVAKPKPAPVEAKAAPVEAKPALSKTKPAPVETEAGIKESKASAKPAPAVSTAPQGHNEEPARPARELESPSQVADAPPVTAKAKTAAANRETVAAKAMPVAVDANPVVAEIIPVVAEANPVADNVIPVVENDETVADNSEAVAENLKNVVENDETDHQKPAKKAAKGKPAPAVKPAAAQPPVSLSESDEEDDEDEEEDDEDEAEGEAADEDAAEDASSASQTDDDEEDDEEEDTEAADDEDDASSGSRPAPSKKPKAKDWGTDLPPPTPGYRWITLHAGSADELAPRDIVDCITEDGSFEGKIVGLIKITENETHVQIQTASAAAVLEALDGASIGDKPLKAHFAKVAAGSAFKKSEGQRPPRPAFKRDGDSPRPYRKPEGDSADRPRPYRKPEGDYAERPRRDDGPPRRDDGPPRRDDGPPRRDDGPPRGDYGGFRKPDRPYGNKPGGFAKKPGSWGNKPSGPRKDYGPPGDRPAPYRKDYGDRTDRPSTFRKDSSSFEKKPGTWFKKPGAFANKPGGFSKPGTGPARETRSWSKDMPGGSSERRSSPPPRDDDRGDRPSYPKKSYGAPKKGPGRW